MAITHRGNSLALKAFGRFTYEPASPAITPSTLFDLASVTKIVATTPWQCCSMSAVCLILTLPSTLSSPNSRRLNQTLAATM